MKYILFDLDGTLTNPKEGITKSFQYALHSFGIDVEDLNQLEKYIGPPLLQSFMQDYHFDEDKAKQAVTKYRERFSVTGIYENVLYDGIKEQLELLKKEGFKLFVATSKPEKFARIIIEHFGLGGYFTDICGSDTSFSRDSKADVISYLLKKNQITEISQVIMVGDREHDVHGAKEFGIPTVGVLYGFGSREELEKAGAIILVENIEELYHRIMEI